MAVILSVEKWVAGARFVERGRKGTEFEERFEEWEDVDGKVLKEMRGMKGNSVVVRRV